MKLGELYGETDPLTYDWTDGLIAMAVRKFSKELSKHNSDDTRPSTSGSVMTDHTRVCKYSDVDNYFSQCVLYASE